MPALQTESKGPLYTVDGFKDAVEVDFVNVYVTDPAIDSSSSINLMLDAGLNIVVSPGIYTLTDSIKIVKDSQVVLGLGLATLIAPENGEPCVVVAGGLSDVRVAGLLLQAGEHETSDMLRVEAGTPLSGSPIILTDIFARVGGPNTELVGPVGSMINIEADNVIIDNTWLWRADHSTKGLVSNEDNACNNGLLVSGDDWIAYGLAVEHTNEDNVIWSGESGQVYFFQAEILYDFVASDTWEHSCYIVDEKVTKHLGIGLGCYSFFRDAEVSVKSSFTTNGSDGVVLETATSVFLNGGGEILNIVNDDGISVSSQGAHQAYSCNF